MKYLVKLGVVAMAMIPFHANAQVVNFGGSVLNTCTITVNTGGTLSPDAGNNNMNSALGSAGTATVVSTGPDFDLSVAATAWAGPSSADTTSSTFDVTAGPNTGTGISSLSLTNAGSNEIDVDYFASSAAGFSTGAYTSQATLTCSE
jgi:hypothetical protein